jgi:hypothetical protein
MAALFLLLYPATVHAQSLKGVVLDQTEVPLPGVRVELHRGRDMVQSTTTQMDGTFELAGVQPGDIVVAALDAFEMARVPAASAGRIILQLAHENMVVEVTASALTSSGAAMERLGSTMSAPLAQKLPAPRPRILQSLPLLPSVVRGRDGLLRIGGTRPHESSLWIDGFNVTDPVTATTTIDLPNESVKGMAVVRDPVSATFSGAIGSLASIETLPGGDEFNAGLQGFIPRPRLSNQGLGRIEAFFPRAYASGRAGRLRYFGSTEFSFERVPVPGVTSSSGGPNIGTTGITSFGRIDLETSPKNNLTFEGLFSPTRQSNVGLSPLRDTAASPDVKAEDLFAGVVDRYVASSRDLLSIRFGLTAHRTAFVPHGQGSAVVSPGGWRQNWFSAVTHHGTRGLFSITWDRTGIAALGTHTFSIVGEIRRRAMTAHIAHSPVEIEDDDSRLVRRIDFGSGANVDVTDAIPGVGVRDQWQVNSRLQFDLDCRVDWLHGAAVSPRFGARYALDEAGTSVLKGSVGRFVGHYPLGAAAFGELPARYDTLFDSVSGEALATTVYRPATPRLTLPYATGVSLELERQIRPGLELQAGVRQRVGSRLPTVDVPPSGGVLRVLSNGTSRYRELQVSVRQEWRQDRQLFVSYVRSSNRGNTNDFGTMFTSLDTPLLQVDARAPTPADVPNRLRGWATIGFWPVGPAPWIFPTRFVVSPAVEWRTGFPYSIQDVLRRTIGPPNSQRFPAYFSADVTFFKTFDLFEHELDLGFQFFNLTRHFNPRDVIPVLGSSRFGELTNSFGLTLGGYIQVRWR